MVRSVRHGMSPEMVSEVNARLSAARLTHARLGRSGGVVPGVVVKVLGERVVVNCRTLSGDVDEGLRARAEAALAHMEGVRVSSGDGAVVVEVAS